MSSSLYGNHGTYDSLGEFNNITWFYLFQKLIWRYNFFSYTGFGFDCSAEPVQMPIVSTEEIGRKEVPSKQTTTTKTEVSNKVLHC
jgi:hypothetical protein